MADLALPALTLVFVGAAAVTWVAGTALTKTTDSLDARWRIGDALGGLILLGITGSLPEIAVVYSAAKEGHFGIIIGNLIGGLALQILLIVMFDAAVRGKRPLSYLAGSPIMSLETAFAIILTALTIGASMVPPKYSISSVNPVSAVILISWLAGLLLINKARMNPRLTQVPPDASPGRKHHERRKVENHRYYAGKSTAHVLTVFALASLATLAAGSSSRDLVRRLQASSESAAASLRPQPSP